jgi:DNA primase
MARISEQTIEQIRSAADVVEVVSAYVELKKRGRNFFGLCPFHNEKSASFSVNQERQIYKCFGCGAGGGSINFIMEIENLDFVESLRHLADQYGIQLEIDNIPGQSRDLVTQLMDIHENTAMYYLKNLSTNEGKEVFQHLQNRGLTKETIQYFKLGYSMDSFDALKNNLQQGKFSSESLSKCGLIINNERGYFDRFRARIMFSIANTNGKTIAFAGRVFKKDDPAKYVNSPETPIYNKSKILYGLWASKEDIRKKEYAIVVEGYLDYLQLYQAGIKNVVAVSGTSFTDEHAKLIKRFCKKIYMAYDGDTAGVSAAIRAGYILMKFGLEPKIISVPTGKDPDDWVKDDGPEPFNNAVENASGLLEFHTQNTRHDVSSPTGMSQFIQRVIGDLVQIEDPVLRELHARSLASLTKVSEESIFQSLRGLLQQQNRRAQFKKQGSVETKAIPTDGKTPLRRIEDELIQLCFIEDVKIRTAIYEKLDTVWLHSNSIKAIFDAVYIHLHSEQAPNASIIMNELKDETHRRKLSALIFDVDKIDATLSMAEQCLNRLEYQWLKSRLDNLREKLKVTNQSQDSDSVIIVEIAELQTRLKKLKSNVREIV